MMSARCVILFGLLGCVIPIFANGKTQFVEPTKNVLEKSEASEVVLYVIRLKVVELNRNPIMASKWGDNDDPDLYAIIDYNDMEMKTEVVKDRYSVDFEGRWGSDKGEFVIPNQKLSQQTFIVTCVDDDSFVNDTLFSVSITGEMLKNKREDGILKIFVDKDGKIVDERYDGPYHTLTFIVEEREGVKELLNLAGYYRYGRLGVKQDKELAKCCYKKAADAKEPEAQWEFGRWFLDEGNIAQAECWLEKATSSDDKERDKARQWEIGQSFQHTYKDREKAKYWYEKAANAGHSCAQFDLGWSWYYDYKRDYKGAVEWFKKAATENNPNACYLLGDCYSMGRGVAKDINAAIDWYKKAESSGNKDARQRIEELEQGK